MKREKVIFEPDGALTFKKEVDATQALQNAERLRETGATPMSDSVCVGSIDADILFELARRAGVRTDDSDALAEFAYKLLQGGAVGGIDGADYSKFRVYGGRA